MKVKKKKFQRELQNVIITLDNGTVFRLTQLEGTKLGITKMGVSNSIKIIPDVSNVITIE